MFRSLPPKNVNASYECNELAVNSLYDVFEGVTPFKEKNFNFKYSEGLLEL